MRRHRLCRRVLVILPTMLRSTERRCSQRHALFLGKRGFLESEMREETEQLPAAEDGEVHDQSVSSRHLWTVSRVWIT